MATNVMAITFPPDISPVHFIKLELADERGKPVSHTFYWRSAKQYLPGRTWTGPQYEGFEDLVKLRRCSLTAR